MQINEINIGYELPPVEVLKKLFTSIKTSYERNLEDTNCLNQFNEVVNQLTQWNIAPLIPNEDNS